MLSLLHRQLPLELVSITRASASTWANWGRRSFSSTSRIASVVPTQDKHFFVTTPIYYVNADPHIGHLHSTLLADVFARYNALRHDTTSLSILCTGTDEHGMKIQRVAEAQGVTPLALCDRVSERFRDLAKTAGIQEHTFIRTTEQRHRVAVEHVWRELQQRGFIYKSSYSGWYAVSDEAYYSNNQVSDSVDPKSGETIKISTETGSRVEWMEEDNYKFRLSAFREPLLEWLASEPNPLQPPSRTTSLLSSISPADSPDLQDLSISRPSSRLTWGVPVPDDPDHTIYVWIDALVNYMTVSGYPWASETEGQIWPPDLMVVGKDIIRFHALYLPAVLLALELPLPKHLLAHGHWTMDRFKMSKSRGNVADPFAAISQWGLDAMRCYLMRVGGNSATDADYSEEAIGVFYKKSLAGQMGNLVARMGNDKILKRCEEAVWQTPQCEADEFDRELKDALEGLRDSFDSHMSSFEVHRALASIFDILALANKHFQQLEPWASTTSPEAIHRALFHSSEALRLSAILIQPVMPNKSVQLLDMLGVASDRRGWKDAVLGQGGERTSRKRKKEQLFPVISPAVVEERK